MSRFKLVRHRNSDCTWQVAQNWQAILERLAQGIAEWEQTKKQPKPQPGQAIRRGLRRRYDVCQCPGRGDALSLHESVPAVQRQGAD